MSNKDTRGLKNDPNEESTDRPQGQRRDVSAGDESAAEERDQIGGGKTPSQHSGPDAENIRVDDLPDICGIVLDDLQEMVDGVLYFKAGDVADRVGLSNQQAGVALSWLAETDDCPLEIEAWSKTRTTTWRAEQTEPELVADGGLPPQHERPRRHQIEHPAPDPEQCLLLIIEAIRVLDDARAVAPAGMAGARDKLNGIDSQLWNLVDQLQRERYGSNGGDA